MAMYEYEDAWIMTAQLNEKKNGCELCMRPLVLCKDCKYHDNETGENFCDCGNRPDDWFCAGGERR